jgi:RNA polymerase sigma factor (sigma-70 family)
MSRHLVFCSIITYLYYKLSLCALQNRLRLRRKLFRILFLRVWLNRDKLDEVENVKAWLYKYASNECLGHLRKVLKQARAIDNLRQDQPNESNTTVDTIQLNEINHLITDAVDRLPTQRKKIYLMSRGQGLNIPEIAASLNLSPNTVKNALVISLKSIREHLRHHGVTLSILAYLALLK